MKIRHRWHVTLCVPPEISSAFVALAHKARTSPSMLGQLAVAYALRDFKDATPLIPHTHDEAPGQRSIRLTVHVTYEEYAALMALSLRARTSASAVGQFAIKRMLARFEDAVPLIPPASALPEGEPCLHDAGSFSSRHWD
jgi:hypothetical protein